MSTASSYRVVIAPDVTQIGWRWSIERIDSGREIVSDICLTFTSACASAEERLFSGELE